MRGTDVRSARPKSAREMQEDEGATMNIAAAHGSALWVSRSLRPDDDFSSPLSTITKVICGRS